MSILGIWMWPQNIRKYGAEKTVSICARAGITDIYFLTKGLAGTTAFLSAYAPPVCERDLLRELIEAAHRRGIRVHAWFTSASDEHYKQLHPESGRCHYVRGKDKGLISLADASYLAYMEQITRELCRNYEIDGLHLDYIRYNHLLYGWAEEDMERYAAEGADIVRLRLLTEKTFLSDVCDSSCIFDAYRAGDESALAFARTRRKDVVRFAKTLTELARSERSNLILSAALMPEGAYDDIAFSDLHYGQNYEDAAALYDYALPMAYSKAYEQNGQWVKQVAEGALRRGLKTIMGLHAYEGGTGLSLKEDFAALKDMPIHGICLFREGATAMAFPDDHRLTVYNALDSAITQVVAGCADSEYLLDESIAPGEERCFRLPFCADTVRVFAGTEERCVYLAKDFPA